VLEGVVYSGLCMSSMSSVRRTTLVRMVAVTFWREAGHGGALSSLYGVWDLSAPGVERGRTPEEETHPDRRKERRRSIYGDRASFSAVSRAFPRSDGRPRIFVPCAATGPTETGGREIPAHPLSS